MKTTAALLVALAMVATGCDTISGVTRSASIRSLPDLQKVQSHIEMYPEIKEVKMEQRVGSRPLTLNGIKPADEVFYLSYFGGESVRGTLWFERNFRGEVMYHQSLIGINRPPPQALIDATWRVMKKIEADLEGTFGFREISDTLKVHIRGVENPERVEPHQPVQRTGAGARR